jgi:hypothetical protein
VTIGNERDISAYMSRVQLSIEGGDAIVAKLPSISGMTSAGAPSGASATLRNTGTIPACVPARVHAATSLEGRPSDVKPHLKTFTATTEWLLEGWRRAAR